MKRILSTLVVFGLLAAGPVMARQWTSRNGGFSVEAELIDVKDGNAVLKKTDGSQISVPLSQLSLGDVRFVGETLKAAEAAVTGATSESPTVTIMSQTDAKSPPADASTIDFEKLRYRWEKGQTYSYRVKLKSDRGYYSDYYAGDVVYQVKSADPDEIVLCMTANMTRGDQLQPIDVFNLIDPRFGPGPWVGPGFPVRFYVGSHSKEVVLTVDALGRVDHIKGDAQLPFLLGDLSQLMIEPLSHENKTVWTTSNGTGVYVIGAYYPYYRLWGVRYSEGVPAAEKTVYTVEGQTDDQITIAKHYELTTGGAIAGGKPRFEATGDGTVTFDVKRGLPSGMDYQLNATVRDGNRTEQTPVRITYRLLSDEEVASAKRETEEAEEKQRLEKEEKLRPLNDQEIAAILDDLNSGDTERICKSAQTLKEKKPTAPNAAVAQALESLMLSGENARIRGSAADAMGNWSTPENVPGLLKALRDDWPPVRAGAIEALGRHRTSEAIRPVAQALLDGHTRGAAVKFLKAIGPESEDAVLEQFDKSHDAWAVAEMCAVLETIGTKKSLPTLEKALLEENWMINGNARKAIAAIQRRE